MESIERAQWNVGQSLQDLSSTNRLLIEKRIDLENSSRDIIFEFSDHALFQTRLNLTIAPATSKQASHLDYREAAYR